jgi:hypothetical protein
MHYTKTCSSAGGVTVPWNFYRWWKLWKVYCSLWGYMESALQELTYSWCNIGAGGSSLSDTFTRNPVELRMRKIIYVSLHWDASYPFVVLTVHFSVLSNDSEYRLISMWVENWEILGYIQNRFLLSKGLELEEILGSTYVFWKLSIACGHGSSWISQFGDELWIKQPSN